MDSQREGKKARRLAGLFLWRIDYKPGAKIPLIAVDKYCEERVKNPETFSLSKRYNLQQ